MVTIDRLRPRPYVLRNPIQHYTWGSRGNNAFIPRLLDLQPVSGTPYAELWVGAHPKAPSKVILDDQNVVSLDRLICEQPLEILGDRVVRRFSGQLPFLFKVLSADEALSIQAHPNKKQARILHAKDPEHYPDDNHKPELAIALDSLRALVGFESIATMQNVLRNIPEIASFIDVDSRDELLCSMPKSLGEKRKWVRTLVVGFLRRSKEDPDRLAAATNRLAARLARVSSSDLSEREKLFLDLLRHYGPEDIGLFFIFILRMVHLKQGQGIFIEAGVPHAYLKGNIVECMANSDNVVRVGLTPKFKDAEALIDILTYDTTPVPILGEESADTEIVYDTPASEFKITRVRLRRGEKRLETKQNRPKIIVVINGEGTLSWSAGQENDTMNWKKGQSVLLPAILGQTSIYAQTDCELYEVAVP